MKKIFIGSIVVAACFLLGLLFAWPLLTHFSATGIWDWQEIAAHYQGAANTIIYYNQFPLWNPYICGGAPALGNPQIYFLSTTFLFALFFGTIAGPKLAVVFSVLVGSSGMWLLARQFSISRVSSFLAAPIFVTSGFLAIHLAGGQFLWLTLAWVPWVVLGYIRSRTSLLWLVVGAFSLTLIGLAGRANLVAYVSFFLSMAALMTDILSRGRERALFRVGVLLAMAFALGAWKFIPDLYFLQITSSTLQETQVVPLPTLLRMFVSRDINDTAFSHYLEYIEYGYYVGVIPLFLVVCWGWRRRWDRPLISWVFAGITLLSLTLASEQGNILEALPVVSAVRNPQRAMCLVIFVLALLAAAGLDRLPRLIRVRTSRLRLVMQGLVIVTVITDLLLVTTPPLQDGFSKVAQDASVPAPAEFPFKQSDGYDAYEEVRLNRGAKKLCPPVLRAWRSETKAASFRDEDYRGEVYSLSGALVHLHEITPNYLQFSVDTKEEARIIINQNFAPGWRTSTGFLEETGDHLLRLTVPAGYSMVTMNYWPPGLTVGMFVTLLAVAGLAIFGFFGKRVKRLPSVAKP